MSFKMKGFYAIMASNSKRDIMILNCRLKMLVLFIVTIYAAGFCQGKAVIEETESNRGERSYGHLSNVGLHQTYDPQSNAEHWMKGSFYQPQVDGQPIYVPAIDQPGSYNEFLDAYYKSYSLERNLATPVPYTYDEKSIHKNMEKTATKTASNKKESSKYTLPTSKESEFSIDVVTVDSVLREFEDPDGSEFSNKKSEPRDELDLTESLKKINLPKTKPKDKYYPPVIVKTVKQKPNTNEDVNKKHNVPKRIYKNTEESVTKSNYDKGGVKYASAVSNEGEFSMEMSTSDYDLEFEDYDRPEIIRTIKGTEFDEKSDKTSELEDQENFEEPVIRESLKSELTKTNPEDHDQYMPAVVKTVKQKPKTNEEKNIYKHPGIPKSVYKNAEKDMIKGTSNTNGVKYASPVSKKSEFSAEMKNSDLEPEYYDPEVIDRIKATEFNSEKLDITSELEDDLTEPDLNKFLKSELPKTKPKDETLYMPVVKTIEQNPKTKLGGSKNRYKSIKTVVKNLDKEDSKYDSLVSKQSEFSEETNTLDYDLESEDYDGPEVISESIAIELNKEKVDMTPELVNKDEIEGSEFSKTKLTDDNQYSKPIVVKTKEKTKTNVKTHKQNTKTKPQLESNLESNYEQSLKTVKVKPNKPTANSSAQKYGDRKSQGIRKKSKGKRRKQYSKPNSRTSDAVQPEAMCDSKTVNEKFDELSKDIQPYLPQDTQIKAETVLKTKPVKSKEVTKQDYEYGSPTKINIVAKSENKATQIKNSKPPTKEKELVKTDSQYQSIKTKEQIPIKSDSKDKPAKENVKYDTGKLEKGDILTRKLNRQDQNLSESNINISNTDNSFESDLNVGSLAVSEVFSKKLNSESTTENDLNLESSIVIKPEQVVPNVNDFRGFSSMNSNIWSMLFNPNAEQNKLKLKRCVTRSNETGFCTYIQNCEVPHIATSLEQLLNNACVIDDIFIGVCCPEFPVQTVKVHWDQTTSDFDNPIEDEFGHIAEDCGIRSNEALELQSWPWKAPLVSMSNGKIFCGGVIVSEDHVLTAAHCTTKIPKNQILVRLGQYDDESGDDYAVVEIKRHAQYNPRTLQNDIALLKLGRRIMNGAHIGIVCLPDEEHQNNHNGEIATLLGWRGIFGTKSRDPEFLRVISNKECENKLGMKVPSTSLCTETRKESERTCNADSGAPLVIEDDGRYEVIGILSWNRNDCDQRFPSTFSRVSSYTGWIKNHIG